MNNYDLILKDAITYVKLSKNANYKERLLEAYQLLKENNIDTKEKFETSNLGIGAFTYSEITIFDRLNDEEYSRALAACYMELRSTENMSHDYGDMLASYGTVGKTPYRDLLIMKGHITTGLTEEEKNKYYK